MGALASLGCPESARKTVSTVRAATKGSFAVNRILALGQRWTSGPTTLAVRVLKPAGMSRPRGVFTKRSRRCLQRPDRNEWLPRRKRKRTGYLQGAARESFGGCAENSVRRHPRVPGSHGL